MGVPTRGQVMRKLTQVPVFFNQLLGETKSFHHFSVTKIIPEVRNKPLEIKIRYGIYFGRKYSN